jgi:hypothetical protein
METSTSTVPPKPKDNLRSSDLTDTWRPGAAPPSVRPDSAKRVEQRATPRTRVRDAVEFADTDGRRYAGVCCNLSLGGTAIQTADPAPFGSRVTVFMELEGMEGETRLEATVRWSKPGVMGVQWHLLGARVTHAILRTAARRD